MIISCDKTFVLVPSSRSSVKVKFSFKVILTRNAKLLHWTKLSMVWQRAFIFDVWIHCVTRPSVRYKFKVICRWLIDCIVFNAVSTVSHLYHGGQFTYPCFPWVLCTSTPHNILSKPLTALPRNHCRNSGQGWERNNPVAMTIINPLKEYWPCRGSNQRPPVLKTATLPTDLLGSAGYLSNMKVTVFDKIAVAGAFVFHKHILISFITFHFLVF